MLIATCTVTLEEYGETSGNPARLRRYEEALDQAPDEVRLAAFPAGFLFAPSASEFETLTDELVSRASARGMAVAVGIDGPQCNLHLTNSIYPWYGICWAPGMQAPLVLQQVSSTRQNQTVVPPAFGASRTLNVDGSPFVILLCGEMFNESARLACAQEPGRRVVDIAHLAQGFRAWQGMRPLAALGVTSWCSVHAGRRYAMKHCYEPPSERRSSRLRNLTIPGEPRLELKTWDLADLAGSQISGS